MIVLENGKLKSSNLNCTFAPHTIARAYECGWDSNLISVASALQTIHFWWRLFFRRSRKSKLDVSLRAYNAKRKTKKRFFAAAAAAAAVVAAAVDRDQKLRFFFASFSHAFVHFVYTHQFRSTRKIDRFSGATKTLHIFENALVFSLYLPYSHIAYVVATVAALRLNSCVERVRCAQPFIYWIDSLFSFRTYN